MLSPNGSQITFVSALYNIYEDGHYTPALKENVRNFLKGDLELIIYTDSFFFPFLQETLKEREREKTYKRKVQLVQIELASLESARLVSNPTLLLPSERNETKDTRNYLALINCKTEFVKLSLERTASKFLAWIDLGITKVFKSPLSILERLERLQIVEDTKGILIPGPYKMRVTLDDLCQRVYWLFCGGFFLGDRDSVANFHEKAKESLEAFKTKGYCSWEVNVWGYIYLNEPDFFIPYTGDHNETILSIPEEYIKVSEEELLYRQTREKILTLLASNDFERAYDLIDEIRWMEKEHPEINESLSIACYYLEEFEEGRTALEKVLMSDKLADWNKKHSITNLPFYVEKVWEAEPRRLELPDFPERGSFNSSSPSLYIDKGICLLNVRGVNYKISDRGIYSIDHPQGHLVTKDFMWSGKDSLSLSLVGEVFPLDTLRMKYPMHIKGLEDVRLFHYENGNVYAFGTSCETFSFFLPRIVFSIYNIETKQEVKSLPLFINEEGYLKCEKNWLPFMTDEGKVRFIYSMNPLKIYEVDPKTAHGECNLVKEKEQKGFYDMRGSANPIRYKGGWLFTVHQIEDSMPRKYYHRLMWYSKDFERFKFSPLFYFEKVGIEFNLGIGIEGDHLLMGYSVHDGSANILKVPLHRIDTLLEFSSRIGF